MECIPSFNSGEVSVHIPEDPTVVEARVVTALSTSSTIAFASTVPVNVGVESLVTLSELEDPLSDVDTRSGVEGVLGAPIGTTVIDTVAGDDVYVPSNVVNVNESEPVNTPLGV